MTASRYYPNGPPEPRLLAEMGWGEGRSVSIEISGPPLVLGQLGFESAQVII